MVLETLGRRRHRKRWRFGLTKILKQKGSRTFPGPFFFALRGRRSIAAPSALFALPAPSTRTPRKSAAHCHDTHPASGEPNQIIDELSPQSVIYRLASARRRGTIGGGSATGAPQEIVSGRKWRISVAHDAWARENPLCAENKCPGDAFRC